MAETVQHAPAVTSTEDGFLADHLRFWASATKFMTRVVLGIFVLLVLMWWLLV